jgi:hypothetical protein
VPCGAISCIVYPERDVSVNLAAVGRGWAGVTDPTGGPDGEGPVGGQGASAGRDASVAGRDIVFNDYRRTEAETAPDPAAVSVAVHVWGVGRSPTRVFEGRLAVLEILGNALGEQGGALVTHAVLGPAGVGKSQLVLQYACAHRADYELVWWVTAADPAGVEAGLMALATRLCRGIGAAEAAGWAVGWLQAHGGWLLVLDDVEDPDDVESLLGQLASSRGHVIVTSSRDADWDRLAVSVQLHVLDPASAVQVLRRRTGRNGKEDVEALSQIAAEMGFLPQALAQASADMARRQVSPAEYLAGLPELRARNAAAKSRRRRRRYVIAIFAVAAVIIWVAASMSGADPSASPTYPTVNSVNTVAFSPDGKYVAAGTNEGSTLLWSFATRKVAATFADPQSNGIDSIAFISNGTLAIGDGNGSTYLWNTSIGQIVETLADPRSTGIAAISLGPHGILAVGDSNGTIYLWDTAAGKITATFANPAGNAANYVYAVASSPDERRLAVGTLNGSTYIWDMTTRRLAATLTYELAYPVSALAFGPDWTLAVGYGPGGTYLWNLATGKIASTFRSPGDDGSTEVDTIAFSPNGKLLAVGEDNGITQLWNPPTGMIEASLAYPELDMTENPVNAVSFSPDGKYIAVGDDGGEVSIWNLATGKIMAAFPGHGTYSTYTTGPVPTTTSSYP